MRIVIAGADFPGGIGRAAAAARRGILGGLRHLAHGRQLRRSSDPAVKGLIAAEIARGRLPGGPAGYRSPAIFFPNRRILRATP